MLDRLWVVLATLLGGALLLLLGAYSGLYDIGADRPHLAATHAFLNLLRERSIAHRAAQVTVPPLDDPAMVREGAEHYSAMCVDCHLAPGITRASRRSAAAPAQSIAGVNRAPGRILGHQTWHQGIGNARLGADTRR
jgi:hypothetical protein